MMIKSRISNEQRTFFPHIITQSNNAKKKQQQQQHNPVSNCIAEAITSIQFNLHHHEVLPRRSLFASPCTVGLS
jgi:hypothetical protein